MFSLFISSASFSTSFILRLTLFNTSCKVSIFNSFGFISDLLSEAKHLQFATLGSVWKFMNQRASSCDTPIVHPIKIDFWGSKIENSTMHKFLKISKKKRLSRNLESLKTKKVCLLFFEKTIDKFGV